MMKPEQFGVICAAMSLACAPQVDVEAETEALRTAAVAYHELAIASDTDGVSALYADQAMTFPPCMDLVQGAAATREFAASFGSVPGLDLHFDAPTVHVAATGGMGYTVANGRMRMDGPDGGSLEETFRDVHVWEKDAEGNWRIAVDVWNSQVPLPCPEDGM